jgi:hypothetical protein
VGDVARAIAPQAVTGHGQHHRRNHSGKETCTLV